MKQNNNNYYEYRLGPDTFRVAPVDIDGNFKLFVNTIYDPGYLCDYYDPREQIDRSKRVGKQEFYKLIRTYNNFALYLNNPVYKINSIDIDKYYWDNDLDTRIFDQTIRYTEEIFDLSNPNNYTKLDTPIKSKYDGHLTARLREEDTTNV